MSVQTVIGRDAELARIDGFLDPSDPGRIGLVLAGESGIGKTTLWHHAQTVLADRFHRILACRPAQAEIRLPFTGLSDLLKDVEDDVLGQLPDPQSRAVRGALLRVTPEDAVADERAVSTAVLGILRTLSSAGPVLVAVDDVQWLDPDSARVLAFAFRRIEDEPIRFLLAERRPSGQASEALLLQGLPRDSVHELFIGPLSLEELDMLLQTHLGLLLLRPALSRLHAASGGNPLFAQEIARALDRGGLDLQPGEPLPVPDDLRGLLRDRLSALPTRTLQAIRVASLLSEPTVSTLVAAMDGGDGGTLIPALDAGVVEIEGDRIRFSHPMLGLVAAADIPPGDRSVLHRKLATIVTGIEERARHMALGTLGPDGNVAALLDEGARQAAARGAPSSAAELEELARVLTPADDRESNCQRSVEAAAYLISAGDTGRAKVLLRSVLEMECAEHLRARALMYLGDWEDDPFVASDLLETALDAAGGDPKLSARIHSYLVGVSLRTTQIRKAAAHSVDELRLAKTLDDPIPLRAALVHRAEAEFLLGNGLSNDLLDQALDHLVDGRERLTAVFVLITAGQTERAERELEVLFRQVEERGEEIRMANSLLHLSDLESLRGEWGRALRHAEEGHRAARKQGWEPLIAWALCREARLHAGMGDVERARAEANEALGIMDSTKQLIDVVVFAIPVLGFIELSLGNARGTHDLLAPLVTRYAEMPIREPGFLRFVPDEVEALVTLGDLDGATKVLEPFEERSQALDRAYGLAVSGRCRGLISAGRGEIGAAAAALQEALEHHERLGEPFERGRTMLILGDVHRRRKQKRAAHEALEEALTIFERLPAPLWAGKARAAMDRLGHRPPSRWELTATEQQIAELVATGLTTQEVADKVFLSPRTVSANLSSIYRKLGIRSRTELARRISVGS